MLSKFWSHKMSLWVIIPVKPLKRSKSRLAPVLSEEERTLLNFKMLENTLAILKSCSCVQEILVVSRDPSVLSLARTYGAKTLQEDGEPGLNLALKRAVYVSKTYAAQAVLVLPADLPLLSKEDVESISAKWDKSPKLVIVPDRHMSSTNMLLLAPPDLIDFSYGPGSFERHVRQAQIKNADIEVCQLTSAELDVDNPDDLELFKKMQIFQLFAQSDPQKKGE